MKLSITAAFCATLLSASAAGAQGSCPDNVHPIVFVDAAGQPLPTGTDGSEQAAFASDKEVYLALPSTFPSGTYYVQLSDVGISTVLATTEQLDRVFEIINDAGVISVARVSGAVGLPEPGLGLGGVGQSIPLFPMLAPTTGPACRFKAWIGTCYSSGWNPSQHPYGLPWGVLGGEGSAGECCVRSYGRFIVGDGSGTSTISGFAFEDLDQNGARDLGEPGLAGLTVCLSWLDQLVCVQTGPDGSYSFPGLPAGQFQITLEGLPGASWVATTPLGYAVDACGCEPVAGYDFGAFLESRVCQGHTRGFWSNPNGKTLILQHGLLTRLGALSVRAANGSLFTTTNYNTYRSWLQGANATNMAYMLSAQVVAMDFNRAVGFVDGDCTIQHPQLGVLTIDQLLSLAVSSLSAHGSTPPGHPQRAYQERLKNALDAANNNQNWW